MKLSVEMSTKFSVEVSDDKNNFRTPLFAMILPNLPNERVFNFLAGSKFAAKNLLYEFVF